MVAIASADYATQAHADKVLGPEIAGWALSLMALSYSHARTYDYFRTFRQDRRLVIALVVAITLCTTAVGILNFYCLYFHSVSQLRTDMYISRVIRPSAITSSIASIVAFLTQVYFAERCYRMIGKRGPVLLLVVLPFMLAGAAGGFGVSYVQFKYQGWAASYGPLYIWMQLWLWGNAVSDIIITSALCVALLRSRTESHAPATNALVFRVVTVSLESAGLTTLTAIAAIVSYLPSYASNNASMVFTSVLPMMYAISLLYALNSRSALRAQAEQSSLIAASEGSRTRSFDRRPSYAASRKASVGQMRKHSLAPSYSSPVQRDFPGVGEQTGFGANHTARPETLRIELGGATVLPYLVSPRSEGPCPAYPSRSPAAIAFADPFKSQNEPAAQPTRRPSLAYPRPSVGDIREEVSTITRAGSLSSRPSFSEVARPLFGAQSAIDGRRPSLAPVGRPLYPAEPMPGRSVSISVGPQVIVPAPFGSATRLSAVESVVFVGDLARDSVMFTTVTTTESDKS
ncbi:uncharacterized protein L969DRAFT_556299 [Mixia osmundae IAM 14324]|nr:uncharacterized protein L969DRAFT_556299 [Mixia osmundae IAM 14324]KEI37932.1 hypothetical protein L969DRAFT_556299 [Mixia osmundae IAM 14324]